MSEALVTITMPLAKFAPQHKTTVCGPFCLGCATSKALSHRRRFMRSECCGTGRPRQPVPEEPGAHRQMLVAHRAIFHCIDGERDEASRSAISVRIFAPNDVRKSPPNRALRSSDPPSRFCYGSFKMAGKPLGALSHMDKSSGYRKTTFAI